MKQRSNIRLHRTTTPRSLNTVGLVTYCGQITNSLEKHAK